MRLFCSGLPGICGSIVVSAEEVGGCEEMLTLQIKGLKLDKKDFFGKSDPFLMIYRKNDDTRFFLCSLCMHSIYS
jgi:copine 5/8/9